MNRRLAVAVVAILLVAGLVVAVSTQTSLFTTTTRTEYSMTTIFENIRVAGNCSAVSYGVPDIITVGANGVATYPTTQTYDRSTYTTASYANQTTIFSFTSTSTDYGAAPSSAWTVVVCTYGPS